jgi:hypothetical protein
MVIVLHLVGRADGEWIVVEPDRVPASVWVRGVQTHLVATGDIEWNGDIPGEVYVPAERLAEWRAEHSVP